MTIGVFEFVLGLCVLGTISGIINGGMRVKRERIKAQARGYDGETEALKGVIGEMHQDIGKLKDRVRVLERLVTDDDRRLADEIERLRRSESSSSRP
jgi:hypothetical protein